MFFCEDTKDRDTIRINAFESGNAPGCVYLSVDKGRENLNFWLSLKAANSIVQSIGRALSGAHSPRILSTDREKLEAVEFDVFPSTDKPGDIYFSAESGEEDINVWLTPADARTLASELARAIHTVELTKPPKEEEAPMKYKHADDETLDITYGQVRDWHRLDGRVKEFFEGNFEAPVFKEEGAPIQFRHVYRNEGAYYLVASIGNGEFVLADIKQNPGNRWGDAASLETLASRATGFQDVGPLTRNLLADIAAGRDIPSVGTVGVGCYEYGDDSVFTTTYGYLRELGEGCGDMHEWLEDNLPQVYEKVDPGSPIILVYYPGGTEMDYPLLVSNIGVGWDASGQHCSIPKDLRDKVQAFGGGLKGWWLDRGDSGKPLEELLNMMGV